jgi:hypothetical protein
VELLWADGTKSVTSLNAKPDPNAVELVKYIPQTYLEKVCTETEPGQQSEFQRELRKVIFSHDRNELGRQPHAQDRSASSRWPARGPTSWRKPPLVFNGQKQRENPWSPFLFATFMSSALPQVRNTRS